MFLGIDVSKKTLDAALLNSSEAAREATRKARHKIFANTPTGLQQMLEWLAQNEVVQVHACLEATGTYGEGVARALHEAGHHVSLVNPMLIRAFGQSQLLRTKTDKADAQLIAPKCA